MQPRVKYITVLDTSGPYHIISVDCTRVADLNSNNPLILAGSIGSVQGIPFPIQNPRPTPQTEPPFPPRMPLPSLDHLRSARPKRTIRKRTKSSTRRSAAAPPTPEQTVLRDWTRHLCRTRPLHAIFIGHNPSDQSWALKQPYAHSTNSFYRLLRDARLAPPQLCDPAHHARLPAEAGLGFADLFVVPGSDASLIQADAAGRDAWRVAFVKRVVEAVGPNLPAVLCCVSKVVAKKLLVGWQGDFGKVGVGEDWGLDGLERVEVWVLPSSSGRAGMKWEKRLAPFQKLRERLEEEPGWCGGPVAGTAESDSV